MRSNTALLYIILICTMNYAFSVDFELYETCYNSTRKTHVCIGAITEHSDGWDFQRLNAAKKACTYVGKWLNASTPSVNTIKVGICTMNCPDNKSGGMSASSTFVIRSGFTPVTSCRGLPGKIPGEDVYPYAQYALACQLLGYDPKNDGFPAEAKQYHIMIHINPEMWKIPQNSPISGFVFYDPLDNEETGYKHSFISLFIHELFHGLGINGDITDNAGHYSGNDISVYDLHVVAPSDFFGDCFYYISSYINNAGGIEPYLNGTIEPLSFVGEYSSNVVKYRNVGYYEQIAVTELRDHSSLSYKYPICLYQQKISDPNRQQVVYHLSDVYKNSLMRPSSNGGIFDQNDFALPMAILQDIGWSINLFNNSLNTTIIDITTPISYNSTKTLNELANIIPVIVWNNTATTINISLSMGSDFWLKEYDGGLVKNTSETINPFGNIKTKVIAQPQIFGVIKDKMKICVTNNTLTESYFDVIAYSIDIDSDDDGIDNSNEQKIWNNLLPFDYDNADSSGNCGVVTGDGIIDGKNDFDCDGIKNSIECALGYNPTDPNIYPIFENSDMDGDGLSDNNEQLSIWLYQNPFNMHHADVSGNIYQNVSNNIPDGLDDFDGDSQSNACECEYGSDPTDPNDKCNYVDSEDDNLSDIDEKLLHSNPNKYDTDGDGISDGNEVYIYNTDLLLWDTDNDGMGDRFEITYGFDPLCSDCMGNGPTSERSYPDGILDGQNDWDADGLSNADEQTWGHDPLNSQDSATLPVINTVTVWALVVNFICFGLFIIWRNKRQRRGDPIIGNLGKPKGGSHVS